MSALRSEGWSVRPSFVAHGPTAPVTLLADDQGLTQLAGVFPVAWQTPWEEVSQIELVRRGRAMLLSATIGGTRYQWRRRDLDDFEELRALVLAHGGAVGRRRRRAGVAAVASVVLLASVAGGVAAFFTGASSGVDELRAAQHADLRLADLPAGWTTAPTSILGFLFPAGSERVSTTTTAAPPHSVWSTITAQFQRCLGVSAATDRVYGAAGQLPDYQATSPFFSSSNYGGAQVASTAQYYATTTMVRRDVAEMSRPGFGACFAASQASIVLSELTGVNTQVSGARDWQPTTLLHGWARGGVASVELPTLTRRLHLVVVVVAGGHYELTLAALMGRWPQSQPLLDTLVDTLKARISSSSSAAL